MSFTTDITTAVGMVRNWIRDTDANPGKGCKPDGSHFSDEEIEACIRQAGGGWQRGALFILRMLADLYAQPDIKAGDYSETNLATSQRIEGRIRELEMRFPDLWTGTLGYR